MNKLRHYFMGLFLLLLGACGKGWEVESDLSYISESGSHYAYNDLSQLEISDSVKKKFHIEFVENNASNQILHFRHVNTFCFYKKSNSDLSARDAWILGRIDFEYDIMETLITQDSLIIESTYESIFNSSGLLDNSAQVSSSHAGTIRIFIKSPDKKLFSEKGDSMSWIWVNGPSFESSNSIHWTASDNDVHGEKIAISTRNTLELKELVHGKHQVLVEYWDDF